jgi:alpha-1,6-mannosyltransferase
VHISNLAAQTGASLFLHEHAPPYLVPPHTRNWTYDKTESLPPLAFSSPHSNITHFIAESKDLHGKGWEVVEGVEGFVRWRLDLDAIGSKTGVEGVLEVVRMEREERLWILERRV